MMIQEKNFMWGGGCLVALHHLHVMQDPEAQIKVGASKLHKMQNPRVKDRKKQRLRRDFIFRKGRNNNLRLSELGN